MYRDGPQGENVIFIALFSLSWLLPLPLAAQSDSPGNDRKFDTELSNVRALPYGYVAVCENNDLKIRSNRSATFIIRHSRLCLAQSPAFNPGQKKRFILCSNDPNSSEHREHQNVPKCHDLDPPQVGQREI